MSKSQSQSQSPEKAFKMAQKMDTVRLKRKRWMECLFIFFFLPLGIALLPIRIPPILTLYIFLIFIIILFLRRDETFSWCAQFLPRKMQKKQNTYKWVPIPTPVLWQLLRPILLRFFLIGLCMILVAWIWIPDYFLGLPKKYPTLFPIVLIAYPIFSVIPQGIVFRCFFVRRYRFLFTECSAKKIILWVVASLLFGWVHILMGYWQSIGIAFCGGLMFYHTYFRTDSPFLANLEHALYGNLAFTLGYGFWLYYPLQEFS